MSNDTVQMMLPLLAIALYFAWRLIKFKRIKSELPQLLAAGAVVIDVRSPAEYQQGARPGSLNIPLQDLAKRQNELSKDTPLILCCASGTRSGMAVGVLKSLGYKQVINAGPWTNTLV